MRRLKLALVLLLAAPPAFACSFQFDPAASPRYYRAEGWVLPGISDFNPRATPRSYNAPIIQNVPGVQGQLLPHDETPYIVEFPAQEFVSDGVRRKLRSTRMMATIVRWTFDGRAFAYSYSLTPVDAHRVKGKWVVDAEAACEFNATFVDDTGDGIFRVFAQDGLRDDLLPVWVKRKKS